MDNTIRSIFLGLSTIIAASGCGSSVDNACDATLYAYNCFGGDFLVTACAQCRPAPNTPGAPSKSSCSLRWANASCVATIDGHRWAGSSNRLDCAVDGGTGKVVHYSFDLGTKPGAAYMSTTETDIPVSTSTNECSDMTAE